ncbi:MAG: DUF5794 domain-containing protein [Candidatus Nanohaloarchaea archaeon]
MVLEQLSDGASRHLSAFDADTRRLVFILCLPLIDGVFATLLVTGAVQTFSDILAVALTIFTGAGALAVLYSSADSFGEAAGMVTKAAPVLLLGAAVVAMTAPIYEQLFYVERLRYAAGIALLVIAADMLDLEVVEYFPVPAVLVTGMAVSLRNPGALEFTLAYLQPALLTALASIAGLYVAATLASRDLDLGYVRRGGSAVLFIIGLSQFGLQLPSGLGLAVFAASVAASLRL